MLETVLAFPAASVNVDAAIDTLTACDAEAEGVQTTVYTVAEFAFQDPSEQPEAVTSAIARVVVASLEVSVSVTAAL